MREDFATLNALPTRANALTLNADPKCEKFITEMEPPNLAKLRILIAEPT
jgi:hypothetical protein